ncbi:MAG: ADP-ribosylglycohydrolase family protein [bacterium]|jgi:ADP-ribosylglycohydrolase|nr:ADP-ribosylglycohydrolase family protein [bacterium]
MLNRAQGALLGQLAGDALGSLVEFEEITAIRQRYPDGVRHMEDGGSWNTIAGQPTDDSEMALALARLLVKQDIYDAQEARQVYVEWFHSDPFDCGRTIAAGLSGTPTLSSQANGALMRISPLGIFGARFELDQVAAWAQADAALTHPHPVCQQANALFTMAIATAVRGPIHPSRLVHEMLQWAEDRKVDASLMDALQDAAEQPPADYHRLRGWVLIAFQNAVWQSLHAPNLEEGIVDTIMRGGDTDTNAAICGALLGAIYGREAVPSEWIQCLQACRPQDGLPGVRQPRPRCYWPVDVLELAGRLIGEV